MTLGTVEPHVLRLEGVADVRVAARLVEIAREKLAVARDAAVGDIVVACAALERIDASVIQIVLALKRALEPLGRALRMRAVPQRILDLFVLVGLDRPLSVEARGQALGSSQALDSGDVDSPRAPATS
ncbi:MAG: STAS domain-containing protein [Polyangiaceae bacterium]|jgi:ABC-type transporter Mla MlaB component